MRIIAGMWGGRRIQAPQGRDVRPTSDRVREAWMSAAGGSFPQARVLDLFAGSGALGLEALSRGAEHATFVETSSKALRVLRANIESLGAADRVTVVRRDALRYLDELESLAFDVAFADPPYESGLAVRLFEVISQRPFARELWVEHRSGEALPRLPGLRSRSYGDTTVSFWEPPA